MNAIAIHDEPGTFSDRWRKRCDDLGVPTVLVNCRSTDIISQLRGCSGLMWHWFHDRPTDQLIARSVIAAAELMGLKVFPSTATCWHFDDKIAQKYLLEAVEAPLVSTKVFFDRADALAEVDRGPYPLVFKLRRGAGSANVRLVQTAREGRRLAMRSFGSGFTPVASVLRDPARRLARARARRDLVSGLLRLPGRALRWRRALSETPRERGYFYVQEFAPGNDSDTRVTIVGERAFAFVRRNRTGDFRASGSGVIEHDPGNIDKRCIEIGFAVTKKIGAQSCAFDFVFDARRDPRIVEVSYGYQAEAVHDCPGHWSADLSWRPGQTWPQDAILEDLVRSIEARGAVGA
jgi:hypothetical protein